MADLPRATGLLLSVLLLCLRPQNFATATDWSWPAWLNEDIRENSSIICDPAHQQDQPSIDRKLGCDCNFVPSTTAFANCATQNLGFDNTPVPARLNVSLSIKRLSFAGNVFTKLDEDTFGDVSGVHELDFSRNRIEIISNLSFTRLIKINLSHNKLMNLTESVFKNCLKLQEVDLSFNEIEFIERNALNQLSFLKKLNLASNPIGHGVDFYNEFEFSFANMEWLEEVDLSNTSLNDFPSEVFAGSAQIKRLVLRNNMIRIIPTDAFTYLAELEYLDLSGTYLTTLGPNAFHGFKKLQTLALDGLHYFTEIEQYAFSGLESLNDLSCEKNHRLTRIDVLAFRADPDMEHSLESNPKIVKLGDNSLSHIEFGLLNWTNLEELILDRNPWMCDCNLQWVPKFNKYNPKDATELRDFSCYGPKPLKGINVVDADPDEMLCFSPTVTITAAIGVLIFCLILVAFCFLIAMKRLGFLPSYFKGFHMFGGTNSQTYTPLPKPGPTRSNPEIPEDLAWDSTADLPPVYNVK